MTLLGAKPRPFTQPRLKAWEILLDEDRYIRNQSEHHAKMSFQDEYRRICEKHEIEIDERYAWD